MSLGLMVWKYLTENLEFDENLQVPNQLYQESNRPTTAGQPGNKFPTMVLFP